MCEIVQDRGAGTFANRQPPERHTRAAERVEVRCPARVLAVVEGQAIPRELADAELGTWNLDEQVRAADHQREPTQQCPLARQERAAAPPEGERYPWQDRQDRRMGLESEPEEGAARHQPAAI